MLLSQISDVIRSYAGRLGILYFRLLILIFYKFTSFLSHVHIIDREYSEKIALSIKLFLLIIPNLMVEFEYKAVLQ
jgi:hypothetical protein